MPNELPANKSLRPSANNEAEVGDEAEGGHEAADDQEKVDADPARQGVTSAPQHSMLKIRRIPMIRTK